ncbi:MAG TPA: rhomboid family intramembrane serine protease [Phycisphaerales bacterium]|nr:rhomboid family intramembrane serine protease [Phycisphaerales bacterium]
MAIDPPLSSAPRFPITTLISVAAIAVSLAWWSGNRIDVLVPTPGSILSRPWTLLTSVLPHVNVIHLLFNLTWMWTLGTRLERACGSVRFLGIVALLAFVSSGAEFAFESAGVGLSGVVYGLCTYLWVVQRDVPVLRGVIGRRTLEIFAVWFVACIALTVANILPVGNVAHGAGALAGWVLGLTGWHAAWRHRRLPAGAAIAADGTESAHETPAAAESTGGESSAPPRRRPAAIGALVVLIALVGAAATVGQPWVNIHRWVGSKAVRGWMALQAGRYDEALPLLEAAAKEPTANAMTLVNLGSVYLKKGRYGDAKAAYVRAVAMDASARERVARQVAWLTDQEAKQAAERGDTAAVRALAGEALGWDSSDDYAKKLIEWAAQEEAEKSKGVGPKG